MGENVSDDKNETLKQAVQAVQEAASFLYDLMSPGQTIEVMMIEKPLVHLPQQPVKLKFLFITRPTTCVRIRAEQKPGGSR